MLLKISAGLGNEIVRVRDQIAEWKEIKIIVCSKTLIWHEWTATWPKWGLFVLFFGVKWAPWPLKRLFQSYGWRLEFVHLILSLTGGRSRDFVYTPVLTFDSGKKDHNEHRLGVMCTDKSAQFTVVYSTVYSGKSQNLLWEKNVQNTSWVPAVSQRKIWLVLVH